MLVWIQCHVGHVHVWLLWSIWLCRTSMCMTRDGLLHRQPPDWYRHTVIAILPSTASHAISENHCWVGCIFTYYHKGPLRLSEPLMSGVVLPSYHQGPLRLSKPLMSEVVLPSYHQGPLRLSEPLLSEVHFTIIPSRTFQNIRTTA